MFILPDLPYAYDALKPVISDRTLRFHHDKHHATYVKTTNELLAGKSPPDSLESVIQQARAAQSKKLFNNAAQAWNHGFFWVSMSETPETPAGPLADGIAKAFGDIRGLREKFVTEGAGHFGSGWVWLTAGRDGALTVKATHDADDFVAADGATPLLVCDLWEHAYYLDHQNDRKGFLEAWFDDLPDWTFAGRQLAAARGDGEAWRYPAPQAAPAQAKAS